MSICLSIMLMNLGWVKKSLHFILKMFLMIKRKNIFLKKEKRCPLSQVSEC